MLVLRSIPRRYTYLRDYLFWASDGNKKIFPISFRIVPLLVGEHLKIKYVVLNRPCSGSARLKVSCNSVSQLLIPLRNSLRAVWNPWNRTSMGTPSYGNYKSWSYAQLSQCLAHWYHRGLQKYVSKSCNDTLLLSSHTGHVGPNCKR